MALHVAAKALVLWSVILVCAVANGALREAVLIPRLGTSPGLVVSGLALSCVILLVAYLGVPWLGARSDTGLVLVGLGWLAATLIFEFSLGLLRGKPLAEILSAYTFAGGNIWPVVLAITAIAPWLAARLRGLV